MTSSLSESSSSQKSLITVLFIIAAFCTIICVFICGMVIGALFLFPQLDSESQSIIRPTPDARITLSVADDGCHVERTELAGSSQVSSLTWVITDMDGYVLLERNAEGEYQYGYYQGGSYRVHMKAWYEGQYHQISDEVIVECP